MTERFTKVSESRWQSKWSQILLDGKGSYWFFTKNKSDEIIGEKRDTYEAAAKACTQMRLS